MYCRIKNIPARISLTLDRTELAEAADKLFDSATYS